MKRWLRWLLWKLSGKDYLPLNPEWKVLGGTPEFAILGSGVHAAAFLPVSYPFQLQADWRIEYRVRGHGPGALQVQLAVPDAVPFYTGEFQVRLPHTVVIERASGGLLVNGSLVLGILPPSGTGWLHGDLRFVSDAGATAIRRTSHRVRSDLGKDAGYFQGGAYGDYEANAGYEPNAVLDTIARIRPLSGRLLDIGCATGFLVSAAQRRGLDARGIDFSPWAVERANLLTGGRCAVLDFDHAALTDLDGPYDIVVMHSVIEHLGDPERALRLAFDAVRPGGVVFIWTLNADSMFHRLLGPDWAGFSDYTHRSPWITAKWLEETSTRIGFEVQWMRRCGIWNENTRDDVWRALGEYVQLHPAATLLEQEFGDVVEMVIRRPA